MPKRIRLSSVILLTGVVVWIGCDPGVPDGLTIRDSLGIAIIENAGPAWMEGDGWVVTKTPSATMGSDEDRPQGLLFEVSGAIRLSDGRVAVADGGSHLVKVFARSGEFQLSFGGEGEGPAEFSALTSIFRFGGDTVGVYDAALSRAQFFTADGVFLRSISLPRPESYRMSQLFPGASGGFLLTQDRATSAGGEMGLFRQSMPYLRLGADGSPLASLGPFDGTAVFRAPEAVGTVGMGARSHAAVRGDTIVVGEAHDFEVLFFAPEGALIRVVRWTDQLDRITPGVIDEYVEALLAGMRVPEDTRGPLRESLRRNPFPEYLPPYQDLVLSSGGELWVMEHLGPLATFPGQRLGVEATWQVFDPQGRWLGAVQTPTGFDVLEVGADFLLGVHRDQLGVETVRLHELRRE